MKTVSRLLDTFVPEHYALSLTMERVDRTFHGTVTISGESQTDTPEIRLHTKELSVASVTVDGKEADFRHDTDDELVITHPDLTKSKHLIVVGFSGVITDHMHGLYPCYYEHDGVKKELLATQFESHHAREVFPCIDEPSAKATFDVTLTTEPDVVVLGNMPVLSQSTENDRLVTRFETTPKMSTYLLAWVVGELHKESAKTKSGVEVNIWATPAQPASSFAFGLDIATRTIDFFDEYFETPYPLPKSDHVALPDFSSAAMENWGLVTYRETALLVDKQTTPLSNKHQIATIIAHELSHQWFGNLVTMAWWNDLWLNESFANIMEYVAVDALMPEWEIWLDHANHEVISSLRRDSLDGVQSIQIDVHHPDEIGSLFDPSIVYAKGGRMLRMLQTHIGTEAFQNGLKEYFKTYAYQNTTADDLWQCFSNASGQDIGAFMNTWIRQPGFPVVHVTQEGDTVTLTQERFYIGPHEPSDTLWPIPLGSSCDEMPTLLHTKKTTAKRAHTTPLRFNVGGNAHFITHYSPELFAQIIATLDQLSDIDRLHILHEQTMLARGGMLSSADLIPLLMHFKDETEESVWDMLSLTIGELKKFVENDEVAEKALRKFVGSLAETQFTRLGWERKEGESESDAKLRSTMISLMLYSERPEVIETAQQLYQSTPIEALDAELREGILSAAVRYATDTSIIDTLLERHHTTTNSELRDELCSALCSTKDPAILDRYISFFKDADKIKPQDLIYWFLWILRNRHGREKVWTWLRQNWEWIEHTFKGDMHFDSFPRYVGASLSTREHLEEFTAFFGPMATQIALKRNIELGIAELTGKVALIEKDGPAVQSALIEL